MDIIISHSDIPFRWRGCDYKIIESGISDGRPYAKVKPDNQELVAELCARLLKDEKLVVYVGNGFRCFLDDYHANGTNYT